MMNDSALIDALGGTTTVAAYCSNRLPRRVTKQMVSNWRRQGIPVFYRVAIKALAGERGVNVPLGFLPGEIPHTKHDDTADWSPDAVTNRTPNGEAA